MATPQPTTTAPTLTPVPSTAPPTTANAKNPWSAPSGAWPEIETTLMLNAFIGLALFAVFAFYRKRSAVYAARKDYRPHRVPATIREGLQGLLDAARLSDEAVRKSVGTDAYVLLRFLRLWRDVSALSAVVAIAVLLPCYTTGRHQESGFYASTIANLQKGRPRMWAPVVYAYFFTLVTFRFMSKEGRRYARLRTRFLCEGDDDDGPQARCSVVVERVPKNLRSDAALANYFRRLMGPDAVHSAVVFVDCRGLENTLKQRDAASQALARAHPGSRVWRRRWDADAAGGEACGGLWRSVDARSYWRTRRDRLDAALAEGRRQCAEKDRASVAAGSEAPTPVDDAAAADDATNPLRDHAARLGRDVRDHTARLGRQTQRTTVAATRQIFRTLAVEEMAFGGLGDRSTTGVVSFTSVGVAATVAQVQLASFRGLRAVRGVAPARDDVVFANVGGDASGVAFRAWVADALLLWMGVLLTPLIGVVQALSNISEIAKVIPALRPFAEEAQYAYERNLVTGYVPVLVVLTILVLIPLGLERLAENYIRYKSKADVQRYVLDRHFYFQLLVIFVTVLSGSLSSVIKDFLKNPASIETLLGKSIPGIGAYFLQLLAVKAFVSNAVEAAQPWPLALELSHARDLIQRLRRNQSQDGLAEGLRGGGAKKIEQAPEFKFGHVVPQILMVVLVAQLYAAIAPVILLPAALYFALAELVYRRNFLLVYVRRYESGGATVFPSLAYFVALGLGVAQMTLFSYVALGEDDRDSSAEERRAWRQAPWLLPLPLATYAHYRHLVDSYVATTAHLHRDAATEHDLFRDVSAGLREDYYRQPALVEEDDDGRSERALSFAEDGVGGSPLRASFSMDAAMT